MAVARDIGKASRMSPVDHRDAIRAGDPLQQLAGLVLDFVTKVISAPLALFLIVDDHGNYHLAEVKADPILTSDSRVLAQDYLSSVAVKDPVFEIASIASHAKTIDAEYLRSTDAYSDDGPATEFLRSNGLGPVVALIFGDRAAAQRCLLLLFRGEDEPEFGGREQAFLRQAAPLLTQSYHCAIGFSGRVIPVSVGNAGELTPREREIANLVAQGLRNHQVGERLHIAPGTVKCHIRSIYAKLGVDSRIRLVRALDRTD